MAIDHVSVINANLTAIALDSFLYGIFFILAVTSITLLINRNLSNARKSGHHSWRRVFGDSPMVFGAILLSVTITAVSIALGHLPKSVVQ